MVTPGKLVVGDLRLGGVEQEDFTCKKNAEGWEGIGVGEREAVDKHHVTSLIHN